MGDYTMPIAGAYVTAGKCRYHISEKGEKICVRLVEMDGQGTPNLAVTMPAGNVVEVFPDAFSQLREA